MVYYLCISGAKIQKVFYIRKREGARMRIIYIMCQFLHIKEGPPIRGYGRVLPDVCNFCRISARPFPK